MNQDLPVSAILPELGNILRSSGSVVVHAAPGAGKTMLVPEFIHRLAPDGQTILVEPRRIAARAAAAGICALHGLTPGKDCGFAVRGEKNAVPGCGILVVTPGILLQMLQNDMELPGISALIFDEFHERSLESDLAFTLALDVRDSLREDLRLCVMSATLDTDRIGEFLHAEVLHAPGRSFPVETVYRPFAADLKALPGECARTVLEILPRSEGDMLVFLPGAAEIDKTFAMLQNALTENISLTRLHGSLPFDIQKQVLRPSVPGQRRVILATNVAESSLTIDGVRCVIDSGWEKTSVFHHGAGMSFLELRRITIDSAEQRAGRAGRTAPGLAVRGWDAFQESSFLPHRIPEIINCDLSQLVLSLAAWGASADSLRWLDPPPEAGLLSAAKTLTDLGMLDSSGKLTPLGAKAAALPVQLRSAAIMLNAPTESRFLAASLTAILEERDEYRNYAGADLRDRLNLWETHPERFHIQHTIRERLMKIFPGPREFHGDAGTLIAPAFPEWIGACRTRHGTEFRLAGGRAATLQENDPLRGADFLAIAALDGSGSKDGVIRLAIPIDKNDLETLFKDRISTETEVSFDPANDRFTACEMRKFGSLPLSSRPCPLPDNESLSRALIKEALRRNIQLPPPEAAAACRLLNRVRTGRNAGMSELPDLSPENLPLILKETAPSFLRGVNSFAGLKKAPWYDILSSTLDYRQKCELDRLCPECFRSPAGMEFKIDYSSDTPTLAIPVQQLYGVKTHPCIGINRTPLKLELLSPAMRPFQITSDLPGFWAGSWALAVKEMRSRYPKHLWADDPANAEPMRRSVKTAKSPR